MEKKLRILQLTPRFPFPPDDGGKIGIANIYKQFNEQGCDITLVSLNNEALPHNAIDEASRYGEVHIINHKTNNSLYNIAKSLVQTQSLYILKHISEKIKKQIDTVIHSKEFDIIHVDHSCMMLLGLYVRSKINKPIGLRLHNIEYQIWERYAARLYRFNPAKMYIESQAKKIKKAEQDFYQKADVCFAITEQDKREAIELSPEANIVVAGPGINKGEWIPDESVQRERVYLILATTFRWIHNIDAVQWLIEKVVPLVKLKVPDIKLTLIGKDLPEKFNAYSSANESNYYGLIELVGYVEDVKPYLNRANIYVAPLFVGGGIRIKILEAMAMELPVIATSVSAEGINASHGDGLIIADNTTDFASAIIKLIGDYELARKLGQRARAFVLQNFSWESNVKIMVDEYRKLVG